MEDAIDSRVILLLSALFIVAGTQQAGAHKHSSVGSALRLCALVDEWRDATEKCSVSDWYRSVDITGDFSASGARELCTIFADRAAKLHLIFDLGWQIHIHSPYRGDHTIASCELR